jgi:ATP-dependent Lhr-like helicase
VTAPTADPSTAAAPAEAWFAARGWSPFAFQREVWAAMAAGEGGLLHATTGAGKTYAAWFGALTRLAALGQLPAPASRPLPLRVLWLTPMRALAADTTRALALPLAEAAPAMTVAQRTGDTPSAERARQERRLPGALVTTPESLSLMLTREDAAQRLGGVEVVVVDEWHELVASKRGVQVQLALARLRRWNPRLVVWGLSATLGNLEEAMRVLAGPAARLVQARIPKDLRIDTLAPPEPGRFSWGGHLGAQMLAPVVAEIDATAGTTLVFTNTRSQAEIWYQLLLEARPDWAGLLALHHGSLDRSVREWVEAGLKAGTLKAVVATSSLDLGVDFLPVERVLQVGSPKGVARLLQRAGRSGHQPGRPSRVSLVPTHTLELVEAAAARRAAQAGRIESRTPPARPLDVLVQHLVTVALGGGFTADELYEEVRGCASYADLPRAHFDWALAFVERGGDSLGAYPEHHRVVNVEGVWRVTDRGVARRHRLQVGTIVSDASMQVKWLTGGTIGTIEEGFIARLKAGDCFVFAGRVLEYVRTREMAAYVRRASSRRAAVPVWGGGKMPLSTELAEGVRALIDEVAAPMEAAARQGGREAAAAAVAALPLPEPELDAARPMLAAQARMSRLPRAGELLVETWRSREGWHLCLHPFLGRSVHLGLAGLIAWRLAREAPATFSMSVNDHGLELLSATEVDLAPLRDGRVFDTAGLTADVLASLNARELSQRRFREIARVAGLVSSGYPGQPRSSRQLQASSSLFYEVFRRYDPANRLLGQADEEVLQQELELGRLAAVLGRLKACPQHWVELASPSPFSLPLMVERLREQLSNEKLQDRLQRLVAQSMEVLDADLPALGRRRAPRRRAA